MTDCRVSRDELNHDRPDIIDHEDRMLAARQSIKDRVDEMLDADIEGFEVLEILIDSDDFMLALKQLLALRADVSFGSMVTVKEALKHSVAASKLILAAEAYLLELEELKS
jgi:hypothetical protein